MYHESCPLPGPLLRGLLVGLLTVSALQLPAADAPEKTPPAEVAQEVARSHVRNLLEGHIDRMAATYAPRIHLLPGSELLKSEYGLAKVGERAKSLAVERPVLLATLKKAFGGAPIVPAENLEVILKAFRFEVVETAPGDFATAPPDPVDTPDGKLHFQIRMGDALIKVGPEKGDFMLFQLRPLEGQWRVVAEYLD